MKTARIMIVTPARFVRGIVVYLAVFTLSPLCGQSLEKFHSTEKVKIDSVLASLKEKNGLQILSLAPSVSYSQLTGVNVGINLGSIVTYSQTKRRNRIESAKLENQLKERLEDKIDKAAEQQISILDQFEIQFLELDILNSKRELFALDSLKYENQEITFSEFTAVKISYQISWKTAYTAIKRLSLTIERFYNKYGYRPTDVAELMKTARDYEIKN